MSNSEAFNADCMAVMARYPDKYFDLAVVDPPYGIGITRQSAKAAKIGWGGVAPQTAYHAFDDSTPPNAEYFEELRRVSKNQVIWGGNYFHLPPTPCVLIWDKERAGDWFADCEIAWTSFASPARIFRFRWHGMLQGNSKKKEKRIHPTQKPVALYAWIFQNYATKGDKILDTHLGSGSSRIAAYDAGLDFVGCELDKVYFDLEEQRFAQHTAQENLFLMA